MSDMQVISETPMDTYQLKKELERIKKRDKELNFRANRTEEYLTQMTSLKNHEGLFEKISKLNIPRLREQHIHKIIDIMPTRPEDVKVVLQGYTITVNEDSAKKISEAVAEFLEK